MNPTTAGGSDDDDGGEGRMTVGGQEAARQSAGGGAGTGAWSDDDDDESDVTNSERGSVAYPSHKVVNMRTHGLCCSDSAVLGTSSQAEEQSEKRRRELLNLCFSLLLRYIAYFC
jgi:hypothetical protein